MNLFELKGLTMIKIKLVTAVSDVAHPGFIKLRHSLDKFGWDYLPIHNPAITWNWGGLQDIYNWCQSADAAGYTHFIYTDGYDTLALAGPEELEFHDFDSIIYSGEKACFPITGWEKHHTSLSRWRYLNHGQFLAPIHKYLEMYRDVFSQPITCQEWAMRKFLFENDGYLKIDDGCKIFQSVAFQHHDEFSTDGARLVNNLTGSKAIFAHGNGRAEFDFVYALLGL